jgi:hypothetical protein
MTDGVAIIRSGTSFQVLDKLNNVTYTPRTLGNGNSNQKSTNGGTTSGATDNFGETTLNNAAALAFVAIVITIVL